MRPRLRRAAANSSRNRLYLRLNADRVTASSLESQCGISQNGLLSHAVPVAKFTSKTTISGDLRRGLGVRRATRLSRLVRQAQLPPETLLDLALDLLEALNRHLSPGAKPIIGLASERWRRASPRERSEALRKVAQARWGNRATKEGQPQPVNADGPAEPVAPEC